MAENEAKGLDADIGAFVKDTQAAELTPVQKAARPLVYIFSYWPSAASFSE